MSNEIVDVRKRDHLLSNDVYHILNICAVIVFPAVGTLYFALAGIWGLPAAEKVIGTIVAIDAFLGVLVKVGERSYDKSNAKFDGNINVFKTPEKTTYLLELNTAPDKLETMQTATFKVVQANGVATVPQ